MEKFVYANRSAREKSEVILIGTVCRLVLHDSPLLLFLFFLKFLGLPLLRDTPDALRSLRWSSLQ